MCLFLAAWIAPWIAAPWVRGWVAEALTAQIDGAASIGGLSLGWLSPIELRDLEVRGEDGKPLMQVERIVTGSSLSSLALDLQHLGNIRIERPKITVALDDDGSNLEDILAPLLESDDASADAVAMTIEIVDGALTVDDASAARQWTFQPLAAKVELPDDWAKRIVAEASAQLAVELGKSSVSVQLRTPDGVGVRDAEAGNAAVKDGESSTSHDGQFDATIQGLPVALCQAIARRFAPGVTLDGVADGTLRYQWPATAGASGNQTADKNVRPRAAAGEQLLEADLRLRELALDAPWLGDDRLRLAALDLPIRAAIDGRRVRLDRCTLTCDVGQIGAAGGFDVPETMPPASAAAAWTKIAAASDLEIWGKVDLAAVAKILPATVRLREGTQLKSGTVELNAISRREGGHRAWNAQLAASTLEAVDQGRIVRWDEPLTCTLAASETATGVRFDRLRCQSSFLAVDGQGTLDDFELTCTYDLDRLTSELSRFVDLGSLRLAGQGNTKFVCVRSADGAFQATANSQLDRFELARPGMSSWIEPSVTIAGTAAGAFAEGRVSQITSAALSATTDADRLAASLTSPVDDPTWQAVWPVRVELRGQLSRWKPRLEPWLGSLAAWDLDGHADMVADLAASATAGRVTQSVIELRQFHAWGNGLFVSEPAVRASVAGVWSTSPFSVELSDASIETSALVARGRGSVVIPDQAPLAVTGDVAFSGDLTRIASWFHDPRERAAFYCAGRLEGHGAVKHSGQTTSADLQTTLHQLEARSHMGQPWSEPRVDLACKASYDRANDSLSFEPVTVASNMLRLEAKGRIEALTAKRVLSAEGRADYDLEQLTRLVQPYVGSGVALAGRQSRAFKVSGPLAVDPNAAAADVFDASLRQLSASADFGWDSANVFGFAAGRADLAATMAEGLIRIAPFDLAVNEGRVRLAPQIQVGAAPRVAFLGAGRAAERVRVTPEMCNAAVMYIAPVLAGVTEAQGTFSIDLEGAAVPLAAPSKVDAGGEFVIHTVDVGPGPLVRELAILLNRSQAAQLKRESRVPFRVYEGRVYHRDLDLQFPELTIRTSGSVGFDQTLSLVAEMPVPPKWIGNNPLGEALKSQTIHVPIGGTLYDPRIDKKAIDDLAAQFIQGTAENVLRGELNRQLDRLLRVPK